MNDLHIRLRETLAALAVIGGEDLVVIDGAKTAIPITLMQEPNFIEDHGFYKGTKRNGKRKRNPDRWR